MYSELNVDKNMYVIVNEIIFSQLVPSEGAYVSQFNVNDQSLLWHHRLGHCDFSKVENMKRYSIVDGIDDPLTHSQSGKT